MFSFGSGPAIGYLACLGYMVGVFGALYVWRHRDEVYYWIDSELPVYRSAFSRYVPAGPFYMRRRESRLRVVPGCIVNSVLQLPKRRFSYGAFLVVVGSLLFVLDFFI